VLVAVLKLGQCHLVHHAGSLESSLSRADRPLWLNASVGSAERQHGRVPSHLARASSSACLVDMKIRWDSSARSTPVRSRATQSGTHSHRIGQESESTGKKGSDQSVRQHNPGGRPLAERRINGPVLGKRKVLPQTSKSGYDHDR
jgi:hypothetical protein